jgi:hypothetical protein
LNDLLRDLTLFFRKLISYSWCIVDLQQGDMANEKEL